MEGGREGGRKEGAHVYLNVAVNLWGSLPHIYFHEE